MGRKQKRYCLRKGSDRMGNKFDIYEANADEMPRHRKRFLGRCAQCGAAIYSENGALSLKETGDLLHADCFEEYFEEHMFDFVERVSSSDD